jgi:hypothetical protein
VVVDPPHHPSSRSADVLFLHFPLVLMRFTPSSRSAVVLFLLFVSMCVVVVVESGVYCSDYQFFRRFVVM